MTCFARHGPCRGVMNDSLEDAPVIHHGRRGDPGQICFCRMEKGVFHLQRAENSFLRESGKRFSCNSADNFSQQNEIDIAISVFVAGMPDRRFTACKGDAGVCSAPVVSLANSGEEAARMGKKVTDRNSRLIRVSRKLGKKLGGFVLKLDL